jgi:RadC-like JAB domain
LTYSYRLCIDAEGRPINLGPPVNDPHTFVAILSKLLAHEAVEVLGILCLTTRHRIICWHEVSRGSLDAIHVHPREVFKPALMINAAAIVVGHIIRQAIRRRALTTFGSRINSSTPVVFSGVNILDHVIIGDGTFVSLAATQPCARLHRFSTAHPHAPDASLHASVENCPTYWVCPKSTPPHLGGSLLTTL